MNGGYFDDNEKEYIITDMFPRRKWLNYLWNDTSVCACDQFGFGTSWSVINGKRREIEGGTRNLFTAEKNSCISRTLKRANITRRTEITKTYRSKNSSAAWDLVTKRL